LNKDSWQLVAKYDNLQSASIAEAILLDNEIPSVVIPKQDSSLHLFGSFELMVKEEHLIMANELLIDLNN
jgi:hypothetical protein